MHEREYSLDLSCCMMHYTSQGTHSDININTVEHSDESFLKTMDVSITCEAIVVHRLELLPCKGSAISAVDLRLGLRGLDIPRGRICSQQVPLDT